MANINDIYRPKFNISQPVSLPQGVEGIIIAICIHSGPYITYKVAWWTDSQRHEEWVEEMELLAAQNKPSRVIIMGVPVENQYE